MNRNSCLLSYEPNDQIAVVFICVLLSVTSSESHRKTLIMNVKYTSLVPDTPNISS